MQVHWFRLAAFIVDGRDANANVHMMGLIIVDYVNKHIWIINDTAAMTAKRTCLSTMCDRTNELAVREIVRNKTLAKKLSGKCCDILRHYRRKRVRFRSFGLVSLPHTFVSLSECAM